MIGMITKGPHKKNGIELVELDSRNTFFKDGAHWRDLKTGWIRIDAHDMNAALADYEDRIKGEEAARKAREALDNEQ